MEDNLVRLLQGSVDERGVRALARQLGHGEGEIGSALSVVVPTFISGLAHKAMELGGASTVRSALDAADQRLLEDVPAAFEEQRARLMDEGSAILNVVFDDKIQSVQASVGAATGLGKGGAGSLMRMFAPVATAAVARHYRGRFRSDRELARELAAEGALAEAFLPRALGPLLASETPRPASARGPRAERGVPATSTRLGAAHGASGGGGRGPGRFLVPAAIGAAILAAILMFVGPRDRDGGEPALLGRPPADEGAGLVDDSRELDMDRAGEEIRERERGEGSPDATEEAGETLREGGRAIERGADRVEERLREAWESTEGTVEQGYEEARREGGELVDETRRGAEDLAGEVRRGAENVAEETEEGVEDVTEDVRRGAENLADEAEREADEAADYLEERRRELRFETARFFDAQELELNEASAETIDEIVEEHAERETDRLTLRGPNPSQLDRIEDALAERGVTGVAKEIDAGLDHIEVVFER